MDEVRKGPVAIQNLGRRNSWKSTVDDSERCPEDVTSEDGSGSKIVKLTFVQVPYSLLTIYTTVDHHNQPTTLAAPSPSSSYQLLVMVGSSLPDLHLSGGQTLRWCHTKRWNKKWNGILLSINAGKNK
jgi:hypothetical protein